MSAHPSVNSPWPAQTPALVPPSEPSRKRRRTSEFSSSHGSTSKAARQIIADSNQIAAAQQDCEVNVANDVFSCFPTSDTLVPQHQWASFVWNSNLPQFTQTNRVNIWLIHADSLEQILFAPNVLNPSEEAGLYRAQVNDSWWGNRGSNWNGSNVTFPFFWLVARSDQTLDDSPIPQSTFHAVQTTFADSVLAAMSSSTASAASASRASASAASAASITAIPSNTGTTGSTLVISPSTTISVAGGSSTNGSGNVQSGASDNGFPHWAIAVIVVLGFLAVATTCILAFFIMRRIRRRNLDSNRNSMGSSSPMMAHTGNSPGSPLLAAAAVGRHPSSSHDHGAPSVISPDGASTVSGDNGPLFSGADAAIMADAFRKALRKPDFASQPLEEGESPENPDNPDGTDGALINRELAEEGRDIRSVDSSRGVRVETLSDHGDTVRDDLH